MQGPPSPDAYGRVTNAARFERLLPMARELLDRLERDYRVVRTGGAGVAGELAASAGRRATEVVRLAPASGGGASLAFAFTDFPGLLVRFGAWHDEPFPACGCDACDEQPEQLAEDLSEKVQAVASGRFSERLSLLWRPGVSYAFGSSGGWTRLPRREVIRRGPPRRIDWPAWPRIE